jgi:hypothetical protein
MSENKFKIGDRVKYETLDEEYYYRGYGINMETKTSQIVSICYKLANGETVEEKKLVMVGQPESKSEPKKKE